MKTKEELRQIIRELKKQYSSQQMLEFSQTILFHLEENVHFRQAQTILFYSALPDEVQTAAFLEKWHTEKCLLLPKVEGEQLTLHPFEGQQSLQIGAFGILEPRTPIFENFEKLDLAVIPGMAFDKKGNRLGRGRGFYDHLLMKLLPYHLYIIGIAFPFQILEEIPTNNKDIKVDELVFK
ncbi:MAG: 5-formyltetrahydrofolate cyclo-ligase [Bacteroidaceae bacterium]|jgi:5-formyltetrahydrofolate cyclo-ligase|nr:5-formyltetrahydrofolate cyclo-ligase [Bacteroidaceae bacterium]